MKPMEILIKEMLVVSTMTHSLKVKVLFGFIALILCVCLGGVVVV